MEYSKKISERLWNLPDKGELESRREQTYMDDIPGRERIPKIAVCSSVGFSLTDFKRLRMEVGIVPPALGDKFQYTIIRVGNTFGVIHRIARGGEVERVVETDGLTITVTHVYTTDYTLSFHVTSFIRQISVHNNPGR